MFDRPYTALIALLTMLTGAASFSVQAEIGPPLDLDHYKIMFSEEFNALDVSANGPGTKWIAHTPWNGDFGDARFADPGPDGPFQVHNGVLGIEARKRPDGSWQSGLLASTDRNGNGFSAQYGYFEIRAKLPAGKGLWPGFWLNAVDPKGLPSMEVDVFEHYGHFPGDFHTTVHVWNSVLRKDNTEQSLIKVLPGSLYSAFHTYGVDVEPDWVTLYFDRRPRWRTATPPEHKSWLMILVNLAIGSGWSIAEAPSPSTMYVDYIRAWRRR